MDGDFLSVQQRFEPADHGFTVSAGPEDLAAMGAVFEGFLRQEHMGRGMVPDLLCRDIREWFVASETARKQPRNSGITERPENLLDLLLGFLTFQEDKLPNGSPDQEPCVS